MNWDLGAALVLGVIGGAGVGGFIKSFSDLTKPARLHRRVMQLRDVRDAMAAGRTARTEVDETIERLARTLLAHLANGPARRQTMLALAGSVVLVAALAVAVILWGEEIADAAWSEEPGSLLTSLVAGIVSSYAVMGVFRDHLRRQRERRRRARAD